MPILIAPRATSNKPLWSMAESRDPNIDSSGRVISPVPGVGIGTPWGKKPNDNTYWQARGRHTGDDYPGNEGALVVAVLPGTIRYYTDTVLGLIILLYADNGYTYWLCHLSKRTTPPGRVVAGQIVGRVGHTGTGASRGPHLHMEKRAGHSTSWAGKDLKPTW